MKPVEIEFLMKDGLSGGIDNARMRADLLDASLKRVAMTVGSAFSIAKAVEFGKVLVNVRSEFQNTEASFKVFLGSAQKAADFMKELQSYAFNNVFEFKDLSTQAAQLLAYGHDVKDVTSILDKLSNVASGVNQPLERFVELYNKAKSRGKLDMIDVQQWSVMGDVISYLSDMLGKSKDEIRDMISTGKIGFKEMDDLLNKLTGSGGMFAGMMQEKMKTLGDSVGLLQDSITAMLNEIGEKSQDFLRGGILAANALVENYEKVGKVIVGLIATYGTYRTAIIAVAAAEKAKTLIALESALAGRSLTVVEGLHAVVLKKVQMAQALLNKTMLANPYVLLATTVVALGMALWALHDSTTAEEKAQKKLNDTLEETKQKKENIKSKTSELISILKDETQTIYAQVKAYEELKKTMPKAFEGMSREQIKALSSEDIQKAINKATDNMEFDAVNKMFTDAQQKVADLQKQLDQLMTMPSGTPGGNAGGIMYLSKKIDEANAELTEAQKKLNEMNRTKIQAEFDAKPVQEKIAYYNEEISKLDTQKRQLDTILLGNKDITNEWGQINFETLNNIGQLKTINDKLNEMKGKLKSLQELPANSNYGDLYDKAKKDWETSKKVLSDISKDRKKYTKEQYDQAAQAEASAKKTFSELGGDTNTSKKTAGSGMSEKEKANMLKAEQKNRAQQIQEYTASLISQQKQSEFDIRAARINEMKDSIEKEMAAIALHYDKLIEENQLRQEKWVKDLQAKTMLEFENANPDWKKKGLEAPTAGEKDLTSEQQKQLQDYTDSAIQYRDKAEEKLYNDLLNKYKVFSEQYFDIAKKYQDDIDEMKKKGASEESIALAEQAKADAMTALDEEFAQKEDTFKDLMMRIGYMSLKQLERTLQDAQNALKKSDIDNGKDSKQSATQRAKIKKLQQEIKAVKTENEMKESNETERWNRTSKAIEKCKGEIDNMLDSMDFLDEETKSALQAASNIANGAIAMINGIKMLSIGASQSISAVEKASVILAIVGAAVQIITAIFNMASAAEARHQEALKEIAHEKTAFQREYNLLLIEQNELLKNAETIFGKNAYGKALGSIQQMKEAAAELDKELKGKAPERTEYLFNPNGYKKALREYENGIKGLANIQVKTGHEKTGLFGWGKGRDIYSSILSIYPELISENGKFNASLAETILKTRTLSDEDKATLQQMIDLSKLMEEAFQAVKDYLSDIFGELGNTMSDALVDAFRNGTDAAQKFTESVTGMLEKLAEQMIYTVTIAPYLEKAQKDMLDVMQNENLTDAQKFNNYVGILDGMMDGVLAQQGTYNSLLEQYRKMAADRGFNLWESDSKKQSGKAGAYEAASQDSITRLEGLYSSMLEHEISIDGGVGNIVESMNAALGHLKKIEENTGSSDEHLDKIEKAIETMKDDISTIKRDGIRTR